MDRHRGEGPMWKAFSALRDVSHLDFYSLAWEREIHAPPPVSPSARHIRLGGQMSYAMVEPIIHCVILPRSHTWSSTTCKISDSFTKGKTCLLYQIDVHR